MKWKSVSVDSSGIIATKTGDESGYVETLEAISEGVYTW